MRISPQPLDLAKPGRVAGLRVLVTGASSGIGRALAERFLEDGARVAVCARRKPRLEPLKAKGAAAFRADVARPADVESLMRKVAEALGGLDALVNNAAILHKGRLSEQPFPEWTETIQTDLAAPLILARAASRVMRAGSMINVSSGLGFFPMEPYGAYCVAKAGLNMLTRVLALEWEGRIAVNAVNPGVVRTEMNATADDDPDTVYPVVRALAAAGPSGPTGRCFKKTGEEEAWGRSPGA